MQQSGSPSDPAAIVAWVRAEAENKDYAVACEWRNVADAIEREAVPDWRCECGDLNRAHEAFCYRCGAGPDENDGDPRERYGFGVCARSDCAEPCGPNGGCIR